MGKRALSREVVKAQHHNKEGLLFKNVQTWKTGGLQRRPSADNICDWTEMLQPYQWTYIPRQYHLFELYWVFAVSVQNVVKARSNVAVHMWAAICLRVTTYSRGASSSHLGGSTLTNSGLPRGERPAEKAEWCELFLQPLAWFGGMPFLAESVSHPGVDSQLPKKENADPKKGGVVQRGLLRGKGVVG